MRRGQSTKIAAVFLVIAAGAYAADTLTFKEEAVVRGTTVRLGDLAEIGGDNAAALANIEVTAAPAPGSSKNLNASLVASRLRNAGLDPSSIEIKGASQIRATASSMEISKEMLAESLRQFIEREMPWDPTDAEIEVPLPLENVVTAEGEVTLAWRANPQYKYLGPGAFRGTIAVDGKVERTLVCKAIIEAYGEVAVAAREIPRARMISLQDLEMKKVPLSSVPAGALWEGERIVGMVAKKTFFAGQFMSMRDLESRLLIKRNQMVLVEMRAGAVHLATQAKATVDGRAGDVITCINPGSGESFEGTVRSDGVVVME